MPPGLLTPQNRTAGSESAWPSRADRQACPLACGQQRLLSHGVKTPGAQGARSHTLTSRSPERPWQPRSVGRLTPSHTPYSGEASVHVRKRLTLNTLERKRASASWNLLELFPHRSLGEKQHAASEGRARARGRAHHTPAPAERQAAPANRPTRARPRGEEVFVYRNASPGRTESYPRNRRPLCADVTPTSGEAGYS